MPILKKGAELTVNSLQRSFVERIRAGRVVPVISDEALFDLVLGGQALFTKAYADYVHYPLPDKENLVRMAKFFQLKGELGDQTLKSDYLNYIKNHIYALAQHDATDKDLLAEAEEQVDVLSASAFANLLGYPRLDGGTENPLLVLANLPLKTILTTSPFTFIEDALRRAGKAPRTEICRWHKDLETIDSVIDNAYKPSAAEPLVYHLHGLDQYPDSLVLTEDDYLEFLVNVAQGQGNDAADRIPALVRRALSDDLIVLGFHLNSWAFRVLYAGLIKLNSKQEDRGICCLQLAPDPEEQRYLEDYMRHEAKFDVFWGTLQEYGRKLHQM